MAGRLQQDAFMEDSEDTCPLCVEEFDLSDKNFRPCPCGYQICQFCYNNIKNNMNGLCPACRRPYDDKNIEWKIISPEEFKADIANQARKKAAARQKEAERKQVETLNRKHLQGLRVVQRNLVYITGMSSEGVSDEELEDQLKGNTVFGQYGRIIKLSANKLKDTGGGSAALAIFITFADEESASRCIAALDGRVHQSRILKAQHGTTKYCSAFLRNETCNNRNCTFLHEAGEDRDSFSRQELSSLNAASSQTRPQNTSSTTASIRNHNTHQPQANTINPSSISISNTQRSEAMSRSDSGDGTALPSTANWAKNPQLQQSRRSSQAASRATPSPKVLSARLTNVGRPESRTSVKPNVATAAVRDRNLEQEADAKSSASNEETSDPLDSKHELELTLSSLLNIRKACIESLSQPMMWTLDRDNFDEETLRSIDSYAPLIESNGGLARQKLRDRQLKQRQKEEDIHNILQTTAEVENYDDDPRISGSLQLGGEPDLIDDALEPSRSRANASGLFGHQAFDMGNPNNALFGQAPLAGDFQRMDISKRSLTPQQRSGGPHLKNTQEGDPALHQFQRAPNTSQHQSTLSNPFQGQNPILSGHSRHGRQSSRYTFANDTASATATLKPTANSQLLAQQSAMMPSQNKSFSSQAGAQAGFYSGVQGPPPGLKSSGTPPVSGGGMFGQGHGFASAMGGSLTFGPHIPSKASGENDAMLLRGRAGTNGGPGPDGGKRSSKVASKAKPAVEQYDSKSAIGETSVGAQVAMLAAKSDVTGVKAGDEEFPPLISLKAPEHELTSSNEHKSGPVKDKDNAGIVHARSQSSVGCKATVQQDSKTDSKLTSVGLTDPLDVRMDTKTSNESRDKHKTSDEQPGRAGKSLRMLEKLQTTGKLDTTATHRTESFDPSGEGKEIDESKAPEKKEQSQKTRETQSTHQTSTTASPVSAVASSKGPRTLRVVDNSKSEAPPKIISANTSASTAENATTGNQIREIPRRSSQASMNIPSTPSNELHSETASYTESHPESPNRLGGQIKSKTQAKKEKRARRVEDSKLPKPAAMNIIEPEVVQEAIIVRKKKAKKEKATQGKAPKVENKTVQDDSQGDNYEDGGENRSDSKSKKDGSIFLPATSPIEKDSMESRPPTLQERIEGINMTELLEDLIRTGELKRNVADLVLNPTNPKSAAHCPLPQTTIPRLRKEQSAALDAGKPVAIMSVIPHSDGEAEIGSHPYPYSIVLPNAERTIIPMASKEEAELNVELYTSVLDRPSFFPRPSTTGLALDSLGVSPSHLDNLSPLDLALSYFSNVQEIYPDNSTESQRSDLFGSGRMSEGHDGSDTDDELIGLDTAAHRWMEDNTREIQVLDNAMGGNHFERARAAALGHGPVRLSHTGSITPAAAASPHRGPPPPLSTHPILGTPPLEGPGSVPSKKQGAQDGNEFYEMFKHHIQLMSEPLKIQNLSEELQDLTLEQAEVRLKEAEDYAARLRRDAEAAEKKVANVARKHARLLRRQQKIPAK